MSELARIVQRTRGELAARMAARPLTVVHEAALAQLADDPPRGFRTALAASGVSVIAEHKRRSPSAGAIRSDVELEEVVTAYARGGARALSVLTEQVGFGGSLADLERARAAVGLPLLRKDFTVDRYQVAEAAAHGADAILLIVAALGDDELAALHACAAEYGLDAIVEVPDAGELRRAAAIGPAIVGINNRDLTTMRVDVERTLALLDGVPDGVLTVAESGLRSGQDVARVAAAGVDAVLVGEALMRARDIEQACRALTGAPTMDP